MAVVSVGAKVGGVDVIGRSVNMLPIRVEKERCYR
jgi:hypothetical protein